MFATPPRKKDYPALKEMLTSPWVFPGVIPSIIGQLRASAQPLRYRARYRIGEKNSHYLQKLKKQMKCCKVISVTNLWRGFV